MTLVTKPKDKAMANLGYARIAEDFYPTPEWCTSVLLKYFMPRGEILEPACGDGAISKVLEAKGHKVISTDLVYRGYGVGGVDFLQTRTLAPAVQTIITNPPYSKTLPSDFIHQSLKLLEPVKGCFAMLLRNEYDSASTRTALFQHPAFAMKLVLTRRPKWIAGSTGSPRHPYSWFLYDFATVGKPATMAWGK